MLTVKEMLSLNKNILKSHPLPHYETRYGGCVHSGCYTLRDLIEVECGSLRVVYDNPVIMEMYTNFWASTNRPRWLELAKTMEYEYNAINNYDRTEEIVDSEEANENGENENVAKRAGTEAGKISDSGRVENTITGSNSESETVSETGSATGSGTSKVTGNASGTVTKNSSIDKNITSSVEETENENGNSENSVAGFDSSELEIREGTATARNAEKNVENTGAENVSGEEEETRTDTSENNETHTTTATSEKTGTTERESELNRSETGANSNERTSENTIENNEETSGNYNKTVKRTNTHTAKISGNIGVTTTQEMIEQERKVWMFNLYKLIAEEFKQNFCVMVYY